ncbi:sip2p [Saccharomyces arboricola H-6]|uniref:Sip2p n=1 Tax=Saccharomyces arboricola (strain H-6 / AS 2.3317 / CBS 10644) TaxID=1160507 RepID=J8Q5D5_SACAR|nr:sip2p [Saccharomyces arboricola H-6]
MGTTTSHPAHQNQSIRNSYTPIMNGTAENTEEVQSSKPQDMDAVSKKVTEMSLNGSSDSKDGVPPSREGPITKRRSTLLLRDEDDPPIQGLNVVETAMETESESSSSSSNEDADATTEATEPKQDAFVGENPSAPSSHAQRNRQDKGGKYRTDSESESGVNNSLMVPVEIRWQQGGSKVYVTGSFTKWRKMIGLLPDSNKSGSFHVKLRLLPGTHRFRFIVDNELRINDFLPTATDQMGNFVNYIEVKQQEKELPAEKKSSKKAYSMKPPTSDRSSIALQIGKDPDDFGDGYTRFHEDLSAKPSLEYTTNIPAVFTDPSVMERYYYTLDREQNNNDTSWLTPPQLPPQLENVILNKYYATQDQFNENNTGALPIPNHVVLNHLVTSSIKHNTLCVASIVRYKQKYVTQILYTPIEST